MCLKKMVQLHEGLPVSPSINKQELSKYSDRIYHVQSLLVTMGKWQFLLGGKDYKCIH